MPPLPTPDDSLFAEAKPYLQGRRRGSLTFHGLDNANELDQSCHEEDVWDDELGGLGSSSIELTNSNSLTNQCCGEDPLLASLYSNKDDTACQHDGEIAALMSAQWTKQERKSRMYAETRADKPMSGRQKCVGCAVALVVVFCLMGLGVFAVLYGIGGGSHHHGAYQCPSREHPLELPSLDQLVKEQVAGNNTSVCRQDFEYACICQNPTSIPLHGQTQQLEEELKQETALLQAQNKEKLDVVFVGQFLDILDDGNDDALWTSHQFRKAHIGEQGDLRVSTSIDCFCSCSKISPDSTQH